jgi:hypothetical protein
MGAALAGKPDHQVSQPWGLVRVKIEPGSGLLASAVDSDWIYELFPVDRVPAAATSHPVSLEGVPHEEDEEEESLF